MFKRFLCLLLTAVLLLGGAALAEPVRAGSLAIVTYDREVLEDWSPSYSLSLPGVLLELSCAEGMLTVSALEREGQAPRDYLDSRLDWAGEALEVSDAQVTAWADPYEGNGACLSYAYTYPDGDEAHLCRVWAAARGDTLLEIITDTWGGEASALADDAFRALAGNGAFVAFYENPMELTGTLTDIVENTAGATEVEITTPAEDPSGDGRFYTLSPDAVVLFPNPDAPSLLYTVAPDMVSLVDAFIAYEESSDAPAVFRTILQDDVVLYMEYRLSV